MNVCPTDDDVYDPAAFVGETHVTPDERERLAAVIDADGRRLPLLRARCAAVHLVGLRQGHFHRGLGLRIDLCS